MENVRYKLRVTGYGLPFQHRGSPFCLRHFPQKGKRKGRCFLENTEFHRESLVSHNLTQLFGYSVILLFCFFSISATAQTVSYGYDDSGNRTSRIISMPSYTPPPPQDSTENVIEDEEDIVAFGQDMENEEETPQDISEGTSPKSQGVPPQEVYTDALSETLITIYPNPTRGLLTVKISNMPQHSASSLTLFDMQGKVITQQPSLTEENKLDISAQPPGTYIMRIAVGDEDVSWKIVKMSEP